MSSIELSTSNRLRAPHLSVGGELALTRYRVSDPLLALPSSYTPNFQLEVRASLQAHWSRFAVGFEYRTNEGGSGEPIGVLSFELRSK